MKCAVVLTRVIGEEAHQPRLPPVIKIRGEAGDQIYFGVEVNFIRARRVNSVEPVGKSFFQVGESREHFRQNIHFTPPIIWAVCCTRRYSGCGSQKPSATTDIATNTIALNFQGHSAADGGLSWRGAPRFIFAICTRKPAKIVTTPAMNRKASQPWSAASAALNVVNSL